LDHASDEHSPLGFSSFQLLQGSGPRLTLVRINAAMILGLSLVRAIGLSFPAQIRQFIRPARGDHSLELGIMNSAVKFPTRQYDLNTSDQLMKLYQRFNMGVGDPTQSERISDLYTITA
jgi:hypothetical protein